MTKDTEDLAVRVADSLFSTGADCLRPFRAGEVIGKYGDGFDRESIAAIISTQLEPVMQMLRDCKRALKSIPQDALGRHNGEGYYYRDELLAKIENLLAGKITGAN